MLNNEYPPLGGGTGTVNKEILERLTQFPEIRVDLITGSLEKTNSVVQLSSNIRIISLGLKSKSIHHASNIELIKYTLKAFFQARKLQKREKYDFIFAWSTIPAGFVAYLLKIFKTLPFVIRVGGPDIPGFEERYTTIYKIISPIIKRIWKKADFIITKCQTELDMIRAINKSLSLKIIYNGVDTEKFMVKSNGLNTPLKIICPARLIKRKGQDILIRAIGKLREKGIIFQCDLIGDGDEKENYLKLANETGVKDLINFRSYIPREKMPRTYQSSDIFILPSYNEGMSNALLEAMACGLPVVVTDVGGTFELVKDEENGYIFAPGNIEELIAILEKMSKEPERLYEMGRNSRKMATEMDWVKIVDEYTKLFKGLNKMNN
ncbi:MAG: glycosyltransferase family 4 protein [Chloroflexia bacterium]|nr:glycosyltransferase family 4 protein [Chloroflexia bacterium]